MSAKRKRRRARRLRRRKLEEANFFVYEIRNISNGRVYFGVTYSPERRWAQHVDRMESYESDRDLDVDYRANRDAFRFKVCCGFRRLRSALKEEMRLIDEWRYLVYNLTKGGEHPRTRHSPVSTTRRASERSPSPAAQA